jgi:uncharacterized protein YndB with AHSA1/START domain
VLLLGDEACDPKVRQRRLVSVLPVHEGAFLSREADVRAGGTYRFVFGRGGKTMEFFGKYIEVTPHSRLVWTNDEAGDALGNAARGRSVPMAKSGSESSAAAFGSPEETDIEQLSPD